LTDDQISGVGARSACTEAAASGVDFGRVGGFTCADGRPWTAYAGEFPAVKEGFEARVRKVVRDAGSSGYWCQSWNWGGESF
jgi:hypothetical protein